MEKIKKHIKRFKFFIKYHIYIVVCSVGKVINNATVETGANAYIFSCPDHGNAGDIAIEKAQVMLLEKVGRKVETINVRNFLSNYPRIANGLSQKDIICIQGGGSFGGLYPQADLERILSIKLFKNNKIISFPQTICFVDSYYAKIYKKILKKRRNVYLYFREKASFDAARSLFPFMKDRIFLVPDVVLALKGMTKKDCSGCRDGVVASLRHDKEKGINRDEERAIIERIKKIWDGPIKKLDTYEDIRGEISRKDSVLDAVLETYTSSSLVVTDRLHGMILSYISETPCVAISNNNGKVRDEYMTWLSDCNYIEYIDGYSSKKVTESIEKLKTIGRKKYVDKKLQDGFMKLVEEIM